MAHRYRCTVYRGDAATVLDIEVLRSRRHTWYVVDVVVVSGAQQIQARKTEGGDGTRMMQTAVQLHQRTTLPV